jgi:hypothetical protein
MPQISKAQIEHLLCSDRLYKADVTTLKALLDQPIIPITEDDVTEEIWAETPLNLDVTRQDIADIYNMVFKHLGAKK